MNSFNRIQYDHPEYESKIIQSTYPLHYYLNKEQNANFHSCNPDVSVNFPERYGNESTIDIDNYLSMRHVKQNHRSLNTPEKPFNEESSRLLSSLPQTKSCDHLTSNNSLLSNPKSFYRGLTTQHLTFLNLERDPQDTIPYQYAPFTISSRDVVKKTYKDLLNNRSKNKKQISVAEQTNTLSTVNASSGCNAVNYCSNNLM